MILLLLVALAVACSFVLYLAASALGLGGDAAALLAGVLGTTLAYQVIGRLSRDDL